MQLTQGDNTNTQTYDLNVANQSSYVTHDTKQMLFNAKAKKTDSQFHT